MRAEGIPRRRRAGAPPRRLAATIGLLTGLLAACGSDRGGGSPVVDRLVALADATGTDVVAVWICDVPPRTVDPTYDAAAERVDLTPADVVTRIGVRLSRYFSAISHGRYDVSLVAGGTVAMAADENSHDCVEQAIADQLTRDRDGGSEDSADVVLAVATAQHTRAAPGGWGTAGEWHACAPGCTLARSRRAAYVGASDFHPDWGATPPLDLVEHELGHTLGLPHSGGADDPPGRYSSALDLMSDSAAPRDTRPGTLDGPDLIAVDRLALGWLPRSDVVVVAAGGEDSLALRPSTGPRGPRLAVLPLDEHRAITVEWLTASGFHAHLPTSGVAIHVVDDSTGRTTERRQVTIGPGPPFTDLLTPGEEALVEGWRVAVRSFDDGWAQLAVERTGG